MTIQELITKLNNYFKENDVYRIDDLDEELDTELENYNFKYVMSVDTDEHRWYVLSKNVYKVIIDGKSYYLGVWEVEILKNECMSISDCGHQLEFFEMEEYTTVSYRNKK